VKTTGPILAIGAIALGNELIFDPSTGGTMSVDWKIPIATGLAVGAFALLEKVWEQGTVAVAWLALFTTLFVPLAGRRAPVENMLMWWRGEKPHPIIAVH
jgi:hypothetical protein